VNVWWISVRRSPARFASLVILAVGIGMMFVSSTWVGLWTETGGEVARTVTLLGPLAGATGALSSAVWVSEGASLAAAGSARRWVTQRLPQVLAAAAYVLAPYLLVAVFAGARTWRVAGVGVPAPGYLVLGAGLVLAYYGAGCVAGVLLPSRFFTPFAMLLAGLFFQAFVTVPLDGYVQQVVRSASLITVWLAAVVLLILAVSVRPRDSRVTAWTRWTRLGAAWLPGAASTAATVLVIAALVVGARPMQVARDPQPVCSGTPRVCLWPDHEVFREPLEAGLRRLSERMPPEMRLPDEVSEQGLLQDNPMRLPPLWFAYSSLASTVMEASFTLTCVPQEPAAQATFYEHNYALLMWIMMTANDGPPPPEIHGGPPGVDIPAIAAVVSSPAAQQDSWLAAQIAALRATKCP